MHLRKELTLVSVALLVSSGVVESAHAETAATQAPADDQGTYTAPGYGNYPRVTELEQQLLGKTYVNEPVATRVNRLEVKQFGKAATGDLCDRLDKFDQFVKQKPPPADLYASKDEEAPPATTNHMVPAEYNRSTGSPEPVEEAAAGNSSAENGGYPRVTELEQQFLGKTYISDPLTERITRLETKRYNKTYPDDALCDRLDRLDKGAEHKNALAVSKIDSTGDGGGGGNGQGASGGRQSFGGMLGKAIMGLAGVGNMGNGPGANAGGGGGLLSGLGFGGGPGSGFNNPGMVGSGIDPGARARARAGRNAPSQTADKPEAPLAAPNPFSPSAEKVSGTENRTAVLERFVFGKQQKEKPIEQRVALLEKRLVPYEHNNATKELDQRVDHLWSILAAANQQPDRKDGL